MDVNERIILKILIDEMFWKMKLKEQNLSLNGYFKNSWLRPFKTKRFIIQEYFFQQKLLHQGILSDKY